MQRWEDPGAKRIVFRNSLSAPQALDLCTTCDGEVDKVTEVFAADAERVTKPEFARLEVYDANRVLVGVFNRCTGRDISFEDRNLREALNLAVDQNRVMRDGMLGYASSSRG